MGGWRPPPVLPAWELLMRVKAPKQRLEGSTHVFAEGRSLVIVAASTSSFPHLSLLDAIDRIVDQEYSSVEIDIDQTGQHVRPSDVFEDPDKAMALCRSTHRLNVVGYRLNFDTSGEPMYEQFAACCRLAKATKVGTLSVASSPLGTPFNEEVEHLRRLVSIADQEAVRVALRCQIDHISEDPDTVVVLCDNVKGLGVALDPSHYLCGPYEKRGFDQLMKYTYNVYLRDSTKQELQVRIGQGEIDYGRLVGQLQNVDYRRALCVDVTPVEGIDHASEMRKLRMLLESLI